MAADSRVGGIIFVKVDGEQLQAKGEFTWNLGEPKREGVVGQDSVHGYKEEPQIPFVEGSITDNSELNMQRLVLVKDATVTLDLANGKTIVWRKAFYAAEGNTTTGEGEHEIRFESLIKGEEVRG